MGVETVAGRGRRLTFDVAFSPQVHHPTVPVEVIDWSELMSRMPAHYFPARQRAGFNLLILCTSGCGTHRVDFAAVSLEQGTMIRVRPGQVQEFEADPDFEAILIVWPVESDPTDLDSPPWYPGTAAPSSWQLNRPERSRMLEWVSELRHQQDRFDGSQRHAALMRSILRTFLLVIEVELQGDASSPDRLPQPYVQLREQLERDIDDRPSAAELARRIGYSRRTLDRACQQVTGQTTKQVIDERIALEVRRHLADTSRSLAQVRADLGYPDSSNFARFVVRHLGQTPTEFRNQLRSG